MTKLEVVPPVTMKSASATPETFSEKVAVAVNTADCVPPGALMTTVGITVSTLTTS